jgi:ABC-type transporter Mla subunit MlaD
MGLAGVSMETIYQSTARPTSSLSLMSTKETDQLLEQANKVVQSPDCTQEDVNQLIDMLHTQQNELNTRLQTLSGTLQRLEKISNSEKDRNVDQIRETIRAIYRVFQLGDKASNNDYPALSKPTGWSGEINDGPTTAYDALPPKKFKA